MTDIVQRLRRQTYTRALNDDAADEIERLRAAAEVGKPNCKTWEQADIQDRNVTIERCAQVVDAIQDNTAADPAAIIALSKAAAAIRALKE